MFDNTALGDEGNLVGDLSGEAHFVGDGDDVFAFFYEGFYDVEDFGGHFGVEGGGGFVEEEEIGVGGEGSDDGDALSLAAG